MTRSPYEVGTGKPAHLKHSVFVTFTVCSETSNLVVPRAVGFANGGEFVNSAQSGLVIRGYSDGL
jgi:hypothetical protein